MFCQLCQQQKKLMKAHIMPNSMNRVLRNVLGDDLNSPMLTIEKETGKTKPLPMGVYDKTIICSSCDGGFSPWEKHALEVLFTNHKWSNLRYNRVAKPVCYTLLNGEYAALKLFVLSMLWKASASGLEYCKKVKLAPDKMEQLRKMLVSADPGDSETFAVRIAQFYRMDVGMTFEPHEELIDGIRYVVMHVPGYKILVQVDDQKLPLGHAFALTPDGPMTIGLIDFQTSGERRAIEKMAAKL